MQQEQDKKRLATLTLAALGIVYGDIGTSPLYSIKEVFGGAHHPVPITPENVLGILSLFFWSLIIVVTVKYVSFIMRANNKGEGGIIALMTLALHKGTPGTWQQKLLVTLGLFGAALFYGDGVITPAISVLSAVEGLEIITPAFKPYILPITLIILVGLFVFQRKGTASVGALFGPVMVIWFAVLAALGALSIIENPGVLAAVNPLHAFRFLLGNSLLGFFALGAVHHRGGGALCRHGALWRQADSVRLAGLRHAGPAHQLLRPGGAAARRPEYGRKPVLPAGAGMGALSAGHPGYGGDHHRLAGGDLRRFLDYPAGNSTGLHAAS